MRAAAVTLLLLAACARASGPQAQQITFHIDGRAVTYDVEVADTDAERAKGLMDRSSLPRDDGMLFVWGDVRERTFHMLRTLIPLDLVSIRAGRVVAVQRMVPCPTEAGCPTTKTPPADAALEINAGEAQRAGIVAGALAASDALP